MPKTIPLHGAPDQTIEPFQKRLERLGLVLTRDATQTLQINIGPHCNLSCRHCHLEAGPARRERMSRETMDEVVDYCRRGCFAVADITGGAPELHSELGYLLDALAPQVKRLMLRSNLTALAEGNYDALLERCVAHRVAIIASFPSLQAGQTDAQRGAGVWKKSLATLQRLNRLGYGQNGTQLALDLVSNPAGAFFPPAQAQTEKRFKLDLLRKHGLAFNQLFTFANAPLGRFKTWLLASGNYDRYVQMLATAFNPCTLPGLMCRTLVSVDWNGLLYDCDFNLATGQALAGKRTHIADMPGPPARGAPIAVAEHCYCCTAGAGFT